MAHSTKKPDDKCKGNYPLNDLCMTCAFQQATENTNSTGPFCSHTDTLKKKGVSQRELGLFIFETPVTNITITWFVKDWV